VRRKTKYYVRAPGSWKCTVPGNDGFSITLQGHVIGSELQPTADKEHCFGHAATPWRRENVKSKKDEFMRKERKKRAAMENLV